MSSIYQNVVTTLTGTSITDVFECPQGSTAILKTVSALNTDGSSAATLTVHVFDSSADATFEFETGSIAAATRKGYTGTRAPACGFSPTKLVSPMVLIKMENISGSTDLEGKSVPATRDLHEWVSKILLKMELYIGTRFAAFSHPWMIH